MDSIRTMITFKTGNVRFTYRIGAIIIDNGRLLCEQGIWEGKTFWFVPGGRAELLETATETLRRELIEELDAELLSERLLFINENIFGPPEKRQHELGLYFLVTLPVSATIYQTPGTFKRVEDEKHLTFTWLPLEQLEQFAVYPMFLRSALQSLPEQITHIITIEE
ncbi:MAG: NUDIX hydrolase [Ktedonobacteraceae bacterium]